VSQTIEAVFDGMTLHPVEPLTLEEGTRVRLTIEIVPANTEPKKRSFLQTAKSLQLEGAPDWSVNLDHYLYGGDPEVNG
jgi:predicted DNA-binding antitoxin AbrB/MazE fold protein